MKKISNNKKQIISDILNALITINVFDYDTMKDGKNVDYRYNNHKTINATIKKCNTCLADYPYDILRDEVYASTYESMLKIAPEYSEDELVLIYKDINKKSLKLTNQFLTRVYNLATFNTKSNLSGYRKANNNMAPVFKTVEYTDENLNGLLDVTDSDNLDLVGFLKWFNENKESFLTKKQLAYLEDESTAVNGNASHYRKRIYESTLKAYQSQFDSDNERVNELRSQISVIEKVLDAQDFPTQVIKYRDKQYMNDAITTYVSMPIMQRFNKGDYSCEVLRAYRTALFKKLNQLNLLLEKNENNELV